MLRDVAQLEDRFARFILGDLAVLGQPGELIGGQLGERGDFLQLFDVDVASTHSVTPSASRRARSGRRIRATPDSGG